MALGNCSFIQINVICMCNQKQILNLLSISYQITVIIKKRKS